MHTPFTYLKLISKRDRDPSKKNLWNKLLACSYSKLGRAWASPTLTVKLSIISHYMAGLWLNMKTKSHKFFMSHKDAIVVSVIVYVKDDKQQSLLDFLICSLLLSMTKQCRLQTASCASAGLWPWTILITLETLPIDNIIGCIEY